MVVDNALLALEATARGMTLRGYAIYSLLLNLLVAGGFILAGLLILSRAQRDWFRWFTGFILLFFPLGALAACVVAGFNGGFFLLGSLLWPTFLIFLYLFPNGRACHVGRAG